MPVRPLQHLSNIAISDQLPYTHAPKIERLFFGGEGGIRTHGTREGTPVFETGLFDHSSTSPIFIFYAKFEKTPATPDHTHLLKHLGAHIGDDSNVYLPQYFSEIRKPRFWDRKPQKPTGTIGQAP